MDLLRTAKMKSSIRGLPPVDTVTLGLMLCCALSAVHNSARCLHLDIKPTNVLLAHPPEASRTGTNSSRLTSQPCSAKLADFGLSKRLPTCVQTTLTGGGCDSVVTGVGKGTVGYSSKEQLLSKGQRRSDIYSLGATLLYAATGDSPFGGDSLEGTLFKLYSGVCLLTMHAHVITLVAGCA